MRNKIIVFFTTVSLILSSVSFAKAEQNFINAADFGAVGNGIADDTEALQAAFDSAAEKALPVYIPSGVYNFSDCLDINGITVRGAGADKTILQATRYNYQALYMSGNEPKLYMIGLKGKMLTRNPIRSGNGIYINYAKITKWQLAELKILPEPELWQSIVPMGKFCIMK